MQALCSMVNIFYYGQCLRKAAPAHSKMCFYSYISVSFRTFLTLADQN